MAQSLKLIPIWEHEFFHTYLTNRYLHNTIDQERNDLLTDLENHIETVNKLLKLYKNKANNEAEIYSYITDFVFNINTQLINIEREVKYQYSEEKDYKDKEYYDIHPNLDAYLFDAIYVVNDRLETLYGFLINVLQIPKRGIKRT